MLSSEKVLLVVPEDMNSIIVEVGFKPLSIGVFHGERAGDLPLHHNDHFDRMLIAQAQTEGFQLMTIESQFPQYVAPFD